MGEPDASGAVWCSVQGDMEGTGLERAGDLDQPGLVSPGACLACAPVLDLDTEFEQQGSSPTLKRFVEHDTLVDPGNDKCSPPLPE